MALWICDVQQNLFAHIPDNKSVLEAIIEAIDQHNDADIIITEQAPDKIGPTIQPILDHLNKRHRKFQIHPSTSFSKFSVLKDYDRIVVTGLETHICILKTIIRLCSSPQPPQLYIRTEAISSINPFSRGLAFQVRHIHTHTHIMQLISTMFNEAGQVQTLKPEFTQSVDQGTKFHWVDHPEDCSIFTNHDTYLENVAKCFQITANPKPVRITPIYPTENNHDLVIYIDGDVFNTDAISIPSDGLPFLLLPDASSPIFKVKLTASRHNAHQTVLKLIKEKV